MLQYVLYITLINYPRDLLITITPTHIHTHSLTYTDTDTYTPIHTLTPPPPPPTYTHTPPPSHPLTPTHNRPRTLTLTHTPHTYALNDRATGRWIRRNITKRQSSEGRRVNDLLPHRTCPSDAR